MKRAAVLHVEISTADHDASVAFYESMLGWEFTPAQNYTVFEIGKMTGGLNALEDALGGAGQVLVYVESEDIAADLTKAESLGGDVIVPRTALPTVGWMGIFADPSGNYIGLIQVSPVAQQLVKPE